MRSAVDHYSSHLADVYAWMVGGEEAAEVRAEAELTALRVPHRAAGRALDLGAGFGAHALPLARRGYDVTAVDGSSALLDQLRRRAGGLSIKTVRSDLTEACARATGMFDLVLCMGDTLAHLEDLDQVARLLSLGVTRLAPGGRWLLAFRDGPDVAVGERRFIDVRSDAARIATCILEGGEGHVDVHDLLHTCGPDGWTLTSSSYTKLRLTVGQVVAILEGWGCRVVAHPPSNGMVRVEAKAW